MSRRWVWHSVRAACPLPVVPVPLPCHSYNAERRIAQTGPKYEDQKLRVLILLEGFEGWEKNDRWEDLEWVEANDHRLQRLAFVGAERWRDLIEVFALKGMRPVEVEYFGPGQEAEARRWLERS